MQTPTWLLHLHEQLLAQTPLDAAITVTALVYVWLAARENPWCWAWGIVSCSLWAYADFTRYNLWVDGVLQIFYAGMGMWGWYAWRPGTPAEGQPSIRTLPLQRHAVLWLAGGGLTMALGGLFDTYTPTALPYADSFITAFSIIATFLTIKKVLENWLYWIVLDALAVGLFWSRGAVLVAGVMVAYCIIAMFGYRSWRKKWVVTSL